MRIDVSEGEGENFARVEWNDSDDKCLIGLNAGGTLHTNSGTLRNVYECLRVLYESPAQSRTLCSP